MGRHCFVPRNDDVNYYGLVVKINRNYRLYGTAHVQRTFKVLRTLNRIDNQ